ncbi:MAG TPA: succinate dehydrogenase cytochrome b subunit [Nocardioides sp.]|nr:succinate dehydrogenase cytochrome b subunit [Nocardioides sp.]
MATPSTPTRPSLVKGSRAARSTIALKMLMAVTGIIFIAYVLAHMYGNLKAFAGHDSFNEYAHHLRVLGEPLLPYEGFLWIIRAALIVSVVVHIACALALWRRAKAARSVPYVVKKNKHSTFSSHWMRWGGIALLLFIVWHLLNFTIVKVNPQGGETNDPYNLLVETFDLWWMTLIYLAALLALGLHLRHGVWSAAQTLGLTNNEKARRNANVLGYGFAILIAGGFSLVPIFVLAGVIEK